MTKRKPPNPAKRGSVFPYEALWEALGSNWEGLRLKQEDFPNIETRFAAVRSLDAPAHLCVTQAQIFAVLAPLGLELERQELLALHLYWLAGVHLTRAHNEFLNRGPDAVRKRLQQVSRAAKTLNCALPLLTPEAIALLQLNRSLAPYTVKPDSMFAFVELLDTTRDLALTADHLIADIPRRAKGGTTDNWLDRWIWCSCKAMERWTGNKVQTPESDTAGRHTWLKGTEAEVLYSYLCLVSPGLKIGTVVGLIAEWRRTLKAKPAP